MEDFQNNPHTEQEPTYHQPEHTHVPEQSLLEEAGNLSPVRENIQDLLTGSGDFFVQQEQHSPTASQPDFPDHSNQQGDRQPQDLLIELDRHSPIKQPEEHKTEYLHEFNFEKELPSIPNDSQKGTDDMQMNFSNTHFQSEEHQPFDDSPTEELMKQHEDFHPREEFLQMQQDEESLKMQQDEESRLHDELFGAHEPVLNASTQKVEESQASPWSMAEEESHPSHEKALVNEPEESKSSHKQVEEIVTTPAKQEKVVESAPPPSPPVTGHHRPAPPIPTEELVEPETKSKSPKKSTQPVAASPPTKDRSTESAPSTEGKTRSVKSIKTADASSDRVFFGEFLFSFPLIAHRIS